MEISMKTAGKLKLISLGHSRLFALGLSLDFTSFLQRIFEGKERWVNIWFRYATLTSGYSEAMWPLIPIEGGHLFRSIVASHSDTMWPPLKG